MILLWDDGQGAIEQKLASLLPYILKEGNGYADIFLN